MLYLRSSAHKPKLSGDNLLLAAGENARDAICLGDQCAIHARKGDSGQNAGGRASRWGRLSYQRERGGVSERQTDEDDVAELPRGRLDYRRVVVSAEHRCDAGRGRQTETRHRHRHDHHSVCPA